MPRRGPALQRYRDEELELGRIELPDYLRTDPEPDPEREPERTPLRQPRPSNEALRQALEQMVRTQKRMRRRCEDEDQEECPDCKPAVDGNPTVPWHIFDAGTVRKPSPRAKGALYQHHVVPWFGFGAEDIGGKLRVHIEEWEWRRGRAGSWDELHHAECKLIECKLGYRDFLDEDLIAPRAFGDPPPEDDPHTTRNPRKPFLGTLQRQWKGQISAQHAAFSPDWPIVTLEWVFSDSDVLWVFLMILDDMEIYNITTRHVPYELAPNGTTFVRALYDNGEQDYGYWEDN
ncbi:hypothetical protein [Yoonia sp. 2307UL14-13]|uniref:hypothetical protein n=1 Tax=Yoonia sp. 2307UL14-13 TaxID=3126506 RepID=UPI003099B174